MLAMQGRKVQLLQRIIPHVTFNCMQAGTATWLLSLLTVQLALTHPAARKVTALRCTAVNLRVLPMLNPSMAGLPPTITT